MVIEVGPDPKNSGEEYNDEKYEGGRSNDGSDLSNDNDDYEQNEESQSQEGSDGSTP